MDLPHQRGPGAKENLEPSLLHGSRAQNRGHPRDTDASDRRVARHLEIVHHEHRLDARLRPAEVPELDRMQPDVDRASSDVSRRLSAADAGALAELCERLIGEDS